ELQVCRTGIDRHVLAFDVAHFRQTLSKLINHAPLRLGWSIAYQSNSGHRPLLCPCSERPDDGRGAEDGDELASSHVRMRTRGQTADGGKHSTMRCPAVRPCSPSGEPYVG